MLSFKILTIEEMETEVLKEKKALQNFPKTTDFPFSELYRKLATQIKTMEIASEAILYNSGDAFNENKEFVLKEYWCFAGNGQGDRWFFDKSGNVFFYDHDYDESLEAMDINFEQWLQMAFVIKQLDDYYDEHDDISEPVKHKFYETLNVFHPKLSEKYPFTF